MLQAQKRVLAELHQSAARAVREHIALASEGRFALARAKMQMGALARAAVSNGVQVGILVDWILAVAHPDRLEAADVLEYVWLAQGDEDDAKLHVWLGHSRANHAERQCLLWVWLLIAKRETICRKVLGSSFSAVSVLPIVRVGSSTGIL